MRRVVAMARVCLPEEVSIQVPPNLAPARDLLDCGIDDLGGVSPVTDDYINPDYEWPALRALHDIADEGDVPLGERLPVYERFLPDSPTGSIDTDTDDAWPWSSDHIRAALTADDDAGQRYRSLVDRW
jgi:FO synthase subunit 1